MYELDTIDLFIHIEKESSKIIDIHNSAHFVLVCLTSEV